MTKASKKKPTKKKKENAVVDKPEMKKPVPTHGPDDSKYNWHLPAILFLSAAVTALILYTLS